LEIWNVTFASTIGFSFLKAMPYVALQCSIENGILPEISSAAVCDAGIYLHEHAYLASAFCLRASG